MKLQEVKMQDVDMMFKGYSPKEIQGAKRYISICNFFMRGMNHTKDAFERSKQ